MKKDIEKLEQQIDLIKQKEKVMKDYIEKVKKKYLELRKFSKRNTSVHNKEVKFIKKSLLYKGGENIREEDISDEEDEKDDIRYGSDYENEQNEEDDFAKGKQSVYVGARENKETEDNQLGRFGGTLGRSVNDFMFKNKLRNKLKNYRPKSK